LPIGKDLGRDCPDIFEETFSSAFGLARRDPELFEAIAERVEGEGQQVHGGEQHGEVLLAVAEIMFEMIAISQDVEGLVLDFPSAQAVISAMFSFATLRLGTNAPSQVVLPLASLIVTPIQLTFNASLPSRSGAPANQR
jgi:hypothetical protein